MFVEMFGFVVECLMVFDVDWLCGVGMYECSEYCVNYCNGYW